MRIVFLLILISGCSADTGSPLPVGDVSKLESEVQTLRQMVNQEVQLRLEFEQTFLLQIRQLRKMEESFIETIDKLMNEASKNISANIQIMENKVAFLESDVATFIAQASKNVSTGVNRTSALASKFNAKQGKCI